MESLTIDNYADSSTLAAEIAGKWWEYQSYREPAATLWSEIDSYIHDTDTNSTLNTGTDKVGKEDFQYADPRYLVEKNGKFFYGDKPLSLGCGVDLAFSESTGIKRVKRDFTAISVIGWDSDGYLYVLEQRRFQTARAEEYYKALYELWDYWRFPEVVIESNVGGNVIANFIKDEMRRQTSNLIVKSMPSTKNKEERIEQTLEPLYRNKSVYHFKGGHTKILEEELRLSRPPTDDLKDSLYIAVANTKRNTKPRITTNRVNTNVVNASSRFHNRRRRA